MRIRFTQHATLLDSDRETPVGLFIRLTGDSPGILLESAEVDGRWGRYSIIASEFVLAASCRNGLLNVRAEEGALSPLRELTGLPFVQGLRDLMSALHIEPPASARSQEYPPITRALYGYLGYGLAGLLEPKLSGALPPEEAEATLVLPGLLIVYDHGYNRITRISLRHNGKKMRPLSVAALPQSGPPEMSKPVPAASLSGGLTGKEAYMAAVARVQELLRQGEAIQVVLSTPFSAPLKGNPFYLYRRLRRINPSSYMFYMHFPDPADGVLLGSSPEVLITCDAGNLRICPIAGTRPRSRDAVEDSLFGDQLLQDPKEKSEHVMLVDLGRNDLGRIAVPGSVELERFMEVERFSHVMHLTSRVSARIAPGQDALDVLAAAFPAGTVSGAPKVRAMEIIAREEEVARGPYAGAIGWLGLDKDAVHLDLGITIRSLWVRDGQARWQAGAGIVHDSVPEKEWLECLAKAAVMEDAIVGRTAFA